MKFLKTTITTAIILFSISCFSQTLNFNTKIICESSYLPGDQTELTFKIIPSEGIFYQYEYASIYYLELTFPFGMEPISSSNGTIIGDYLSLNPISDQTISWGNSSHTVGSPWDENYEICQGITNFSVVVNSHELLEDIQEIEAKIAINYFDHPSYFDIQTVEVPQSSDVDIQLSSFYVNSNNNLGMVIYNKGNVAIDTYSIKYKINGGQEHTHTEESGIQVDEYDIKQIDISSIIPASGNAIISVEVCAEGDISPNTNKITKIIEVGNPSLFNNTHNNDLGLYFPSFRLNSANETENDFISADDFSIPENETWNISQICAYGYIIESPIPDRYAIEIYTDNDGIPGESLHYEEIISLEQNILSKNSLNLNEPLQLSSGRYWLSVYGIFDNGTSPETINWNWRYADMTGEDKYFCYMSELDFAAYSSQEWGLYGEVSQQNILLFKIFGVIPTNIENKYSQTNNIKLYPNPATDIIYCNTESNFSYSIYDICGKCIVSGVSKNNSINTKNLCSGKYIVKITSNDNVYTKPFVKLND